MSDVDADAGTLTVISGDVDGKVAEVSLRADEITDVIDLAAAHKAQEEEDKREYIDGVEPAEDAGTSLVIWAIDPASLASPYAVALLADEGTSTTKNDLGKYLNKVTFRKNVNGNWQNISSTESVEDGDTINLILEFNLPRGTLTGANNTITYKLPNGLKLKEAIIDYDIVDASNSDKPVGKYTIRTDGTVVMTFTDLGSVGDALDGKLTFEAEADYQSAPNGTIDFGNHTTTLNVTEKNRSSRICPLTRVLNITTATARERGAMIRVITMPIGRLRYLPRTAPAARYICVIRWTPKRASRQSILRIFPSN